MKTEWSIPRSGRFQRAMLFTRSGGRKVADLS
jgi:hypothetical protein